MPGSPPTAFQIPNGIQDIRSFVLSIRGRPARTPSSTNNLTNTQRNPRHSCIRAVNSWMAGPHPAIHQQSHKHPTESKTFVHSCCQFVDGQPAPGNPPTISQTPNGIQDIRVFVLSIRGRPAHTLRSTNAFTIPQQKQGHSCIRAANSWTAGPHPAVHLSPFLPLKRGNRKR